MMNHRLTVAAALATAAASLSLFAVLHGAAWMVAGFGAITVVALAGTLTRMATVPAAVAAAIVVLVASIPLLVGHGWAGLIGGLILIALAGLSATGNRPARTFAILATYVSCLLVYLNLVFASASSYGWIIPSPASADLLARLPSQASPQFQYSPPVPATKPIDFVAALGIGGIAIIVDLIAVRIRRPALAGLPLLLLFSVPVASNLKSFGVDQTLTFALALGAYLTLLSTDGRQRLRMWGRLVTVRRMTADEGGSGPDTKDMAATGRRIGLAAVCLAIVVPIVVPTTKPHDIFGKTPGGAGASGGSASSGGESPLLDVRTWLNERHPLPVLTYTTNAVDPQQDYLQQYVLSYDYKTDSWPVIDSHPTQAKSSRLPDEIPGLAKGTPARSVQTRITIDDQAPGAQVPLPYAPVRVTGLPARQLSEAAGTLMVFDAVQQTKLLLTVTSDVADPSTQDLNLAQVESVPIEIQNAYAGYRGPDKAGLLAIAEQHTKNAQGWLQEATDLQNWLATTGGFTYTLKPSFPGSGDWLKQFLTTRRSGMCQQFAWAFAVLARLLGMPSRIVVGYTAGTSNADGTQWKVTTADAHAWPEIYFPSVGWVRFEPTPGGNAGQGTAETPEYTFNVSPGGSPNPQVGAATGPSGTSAGKTTNPGARTHLAGLGGSGDTGAGAAKSAGFPVWLVVVLVALLILVAPALGRWLTRRRRWMRASGDAGLATAAWRELQDSLTDYGLATLPSDSPRTTVRRVAEAAGLAPGPCAALARLGHAVERARYSLGPQPGASLPADVATVRRAIAAGASRGQRLRAFLLPPSTLAAVSAFLQSLGRATNWIDTSWPTMRRQVRRAVLRRAG
jgi:transglutaminase-like putative cysteine protease